MSYVRFGKTKIPDQLVEDAASLEQTLWPAMLWIFLTIAVTVGMVLVLDWAGMPLPTVDDHVVSRTD